jgi:hypothetical protein
MCRGGGTGRRTGLKILRSERVMTVRFCSSAPFFYSCFIENSATHPTLDPWSPIHNKQQDRQ